MKDKYELVKGTCKECCFNGGFLICLKTSLPEDRQYELNNEIGYCADNEKYDYCYKLKEK